MPIARIIALRSKKPALWQLSRTVVMPNPRRPRGAGLPVVSLMMVESGVGMFWWGWENEGLAPGRALNKGKTIKMGRFVFNRGFNAD